MQSNLNQEMNLVESEIKIESINDNSIFQIIIFHDKSIDISKLFIRN
jgi:hypothetical protein